MDGDSGPGDSETGDGIRTAHNESHESTGRLGYKRLGAVLDALNNSVRSFDHIVYTMANTIE